LGAEQPGEELSVAEVLLVGVGELRVEDGGDAVEVEELDECRLLRRDGLDAAEVGEQGLPPLVQRPPECAAPRRQRAAAERLYRLLERVDAALEVWAKAFSA
jgi:hypothetical protein